MMRALALILVGLAAIAGSPAKADQILGQGRIDTSNRVVLPGGPTLGKWQSGKYTATPDTLTLPATSNGSTGDVSGMAVAADTTNATSVTTLGRIVDWFSGVKTVAALRASNRGIMSTGLTLGYYAAGDGGGARYIYAAGDTSTADDGCGTIVGADGSRWKLAQVALIDVKQCGAKMDGSTDDTTALQNTINAVTGQAATGGIGRINIPPGTLKTLAVSLKSNLSIKGSGKNVTIIKPGSATTNIFNMAGSDTPTAGATTFNNVSIGDLSIDTLGSAQTAGIYFYAFNCYACTFNDIRTVGAYDVYYMLGTQSAHNYVERNESFGHKDRWMIIEGGAAHKVNNNLVDGATGSSNTTPDFGASQAQACVEIRHDGGSFFTNNDFQRCGNSVNIVPGNGQAVNWLLFVSNYSDTNTGNGLTLNPTGTGMINNARFIGFWTATNKGGGVNMVCSVNNSKTGQIMNTQFTGHLSQNNNYSGLSMGCGYGTRVIGGTFAGNSLVNANNSSGIDVAAGVSHFTIQGVAFANLALNPDGTRLVSANQYKAVNIAVGASDYYIVNNNDFTGGYINGTTGLSDGGSGTNKALGTATTPNWN